MPGPDVVADAPIASEVGGDPVQIPVAANDKAEQLGFAFQPIAQGNAKYDLQTNSGDSGMIEVADIAAWTGFFGTSVTTAPCPTP